MAQTNETEVLGLFGIFVLIGANDKTELDYHDMLSKKLDKSSYIAIMSHNKYRELIKILWFDDKATRADRKSMDKFDQIREIFDLLNNTFLKNFTLGINVDIDEMFSLLRWRCSFKLFMLAGSSTLYKIIMEEYVDKIECRIST